MNERIDAIPSKIDLGSYGTPQKTSGYVLKFTMLLDRFGSWPIPTPSESPFSSRPEAESLAGGPLQQAAPRCGSGDGMALLKVIAVYFPKGKSTLWGICFCFLAGVP